MLGSIPGCATDFKSLANDADFLRLKEAIRRDNPPVHEAQPAFVISESDLMPEGIAWSARQERFYLGSMKRKIVVVDGTRATSFLRLRAAWESSLGCAWMMSGASFGRLPSN